MVVGTKTWRAFLHADASGALNSLSTTTSFLGVRFDRVGGFIVEPTNAGYIAAVVMLIAILAPGVSSQARSLSAGVFWYILAAGGVTLFLSAAKNGLLILAVGILCRVLMSMRIRIHGVATISFIATFTAVAFYIGLSKGFPLMFRSFSAPMSIVGGDSTTLHFAGLLFGMRSAVTQFLGHGVGVGGNFGGIAEQIGIEKLATGAESSWGVIAYQTGLLGVLAWLALILAICSALGRVSSALLISWAASCMFAEAMLGPQVSGLLIIAAALLRATDEAPHQTVRNPSGLTASSHSRDAPIFVKRRVAVL